LVGLIVVSPLAEALQALRLRRKSKSIPPVVAVNAGNAASLNDVKAEISSGSFNNNFKIIQ
jgi:hypothetical protein